MMTTHTFYGEIQTLPKPTKENNMSLTSHLSELRKKHESLSGKIEVEQRSPASDDLNVAELKKEKLRLKDEIERISAQV